MEDLFATTDWAAWAAFTAAVKKERGNRCQVVGGELVVSNLVNLKAAQKLQACDAVVLKARCS